MYYVLLLEVFEHSHLPSLYLQSQDSQIKSPSQPSLFFLPTAILQDLNLTVRSLWLQFKSFGLESVFITTRACLISFLFLPC